MTFLRKYRRVWPWLGLAAWFAYWTFLAPGRGSCASVPLWLQYALYALLGCVMLFMLWTLWSMRKLHRDLRQGLEEKP